MRISGVGTTYQKRHIGICTVEGETTSLNQLLVRQGFALNFEPSARGQFKDDEAGAKDNRRGLWKGCFVAPQEFRWGKKDGAFWAARAGPTRIAKYARCCSPTHPAMPPGCSIKAKFAVRARVTGNVGIYHLQAMPQLSRADQARPLVLFRGRCPGRRVSQGV